MSKNDMVMVKRELLERCRQFTLDIKSPVCLRLDLDTALNKPVEQNQGEVELLIAQCVQKDALIAEMDRIGSAQLDEAHALLRDIDDFMDREDISPGYDIELRMSKVFTASAEPSAPAAQCTNEDSWNCKYCRNTESCEALKDPRNFGKPSAPVEIDERAEFEAWYADWFNDLYKPTKPLTAESMKASRKGNDYGAGSLGKNGKWAGWQARAALERKPS